jgi:hypothetical protein
MPAALTILGAVSDDWQLPLQIASAGVREGLLLRTAAVRTHAFGDAGPDWAEVDA